VNNMKNLLITLLLATGLFFGTSCSPKENTKPPEDKNIVVLPNGEEITVNTSEITPKSAEYTGQGIKYYRKVNIARVVSPFGKGAGEVLDGQKPAQISVGNTPAINITPDGIGATKSGESEFKGGSGSATWLSNIFTWIKDWFWIGAIGLIVLLLLPIFVPAAGPIVSAIFTGIGKFFTWLIPIIGGLIEWIKGLFTKKAVTQIVDGNANFLNQIENDERLPEDAKMYVIDIFKRTHNEAQDVKTKEFVGTLLKK
jgi:hypothetical protein